MIREFLVYLEYLRNDETVFCNSWTVQSLSVIDSKNCKKQGFDLLWDKIIEVKGPPAVSRKKKNEEDNELSSKQKYRRLYFNILDSIINHIKTRFSSLENMRFFEVFNTSKYTYFTSDIGKSKLQKIICDLDRLYP